MGTTRLAPGGPADTVPGAPLVAVSALALIAGGAPLLTGSEVIEPLVWHPASRTASRRSTLALPGESRYCMVG